MQHGTHYVLHDLSNMAYHVTTEPPDCDTKSGMLPRSPADTQYACNTAGS